MKGQAVNPFSMANANYYDNIIMFAHCHFTIVTPLAGLLSQEFRHTGGGLSMMEPRGDVNQPCFSYTERFIIAGIRHSCSLVSNCIYINRLLDLGHIIPSVPAELQPEEGIQHMAPVCRWLLRKERRHLHGEMLYFCLTQNNLLKTQSELSVRLWKLNSKCSHLHIPQMSYH